MVFVAGGGEPEQTNSCLQQPDGRSPLNHPATHLALQQPHLLLAMGQQQPASPPVSLSLEVSDGFLPPSRSCCASAAIFCDDQHGARRLVSANRGRRYKRLTVYAAMRVDVTTARMSSHSAAAHEVHREEAVVNMTTLFVAAVDVTSSCRGGQEDMSR